MTKTEKEQLHLAAQLGWLYSKEVDHSTKPSSLIILDGPQQKWRETEGFSKALKRTEDQLIGNIHDNIDIIVLLHGSWWLSPFQPHFWSLRDRPLTETEFSLVRKEQGSIESFLLPFYSFLGFLIKPLVNIGIKEQGERINKINYPLLFSSSFSIAHEILLLLLMYSIAWKKEPLFYIDVNNRISAQTLLGLYASKDSSVYSFWS